jgi:signal transduction histidine kinase
MDNLLINKILVLATNLIGFWLIIWVLRSDPKARNNKFFALTTLPIILWVNFAFLCQFFTEALSSIIMARLGYGMAALFFLSFYFFSESFLSSKKQRSRLFTRIIWLLCIFDFVFAVFTNQLVRDVANTNWGNLPIMGSGSFIYFFSIFFLTVFIIFDLILKYYQASREEKLRVQYFLVGFFIFIAANLVFNVVLPFWQQIPQYYQFGDYSAIILLGFTAYAIVKRKLFGMKVVLTELLVGFIAILLLVNFLASENTFEYLWKGALLGAFVVFGFLLIKSVQREIEQKEEMDRMATKLATAHIKLEGAYDQLKQLDEAKSEFISIASHQLRTPLTAIKGYISMILEGDYGRLARKTLKPIENIYYSSERLIALVNSLLNISRLESGKITMDYSEVNIADVAKDVVKELEVQAEKKSLELAVEAAAGFPATAWTDHDKIRNIILNLVDNAIKYTAQGGVTVLLQPAENKKFRIVVQDTGAGLDPDEISKLFESFSRAGAGQRVWVEGAGLGLYIARKFVEMHQGKVWVESEGKGKGSRFIAELPIEKPVGLVKNEPLAKTGVFT